MHAFSQRRHASAQTRQCSCMFACCSHSVAHRAHAVRHASSSARPASVSPPPNRDRTRPVASQMSTHSKFRRMHSVSSATIFSLRHASAHAEHVATHSRHASIHVARASASAASTVGWVRTISSIDDTSSLLWVVEVPVRVQHYADTLRNAGALIGDGEASRPRSVGCTEARASEGSRCACVAARDEARWWPRFNEHVPGELG